jgi:hypothetical protein
MRTTGLATFTLFGNAVPQRQCPAPLARDATGSVAIASSASRRLIRRELASVERRQCKVTAPTEKV